MQIFFLILTVLMALVMLFDFTRYLIPNWLVGLVVAFYLPMVFIAHHHVQWLYAVGTALAVFGVGYVMYIRRMMGGGDIKLLAACALWTGYAHVLDLLLITALLGGVLAVALLVARNSLPRFAPSYAHSKKLPRLLKAGEPMPYGLAIAGAFLLLLWAQQLPGVTLH